MRADRPAVFGSAFAMGLLLFGCASSGTHSQPFDGAGRGGSGGEISPGHGGDTTSESGGEGGSSDQGGNGSSGESGSSGEGGNGSSGEGSGEGGGGSGGSNPGGSNAGGSGSGGSGSSVQPPSCLRDLFEACPLAEACTVDDVNGNGSLQRSCYDGGVRAVMTKGSECSNRELQVYKANGSLCYSYAVVAFAAHACEGPVTTWRDSDGAVVATGSQSSTGSGTSGTTVNIHCENGDGASCKVSASSNCSSVLGSGPVCAPGVCADF